MTHGARVLPGPAAIRRTLYDAVSAGAAGPDDAAERFIAWLGARFDSPARFVATLLEPRFHLRFLAARARAVFLRGPAWRRAFAIVFHAAVIGATPWSGLITWAIFAGPLFQAATLTQWSTEHFWGARPVGANPVDTATAVTYGRLLLPDPARSGWWLRLLAYVPVRFLLLSGDLVNHDLHHIGRGPWTRHASIQTRLLRDGRIPIRQTASLRAGFAVAFRSARGVEPRPPRAMSRRRLLGM